LSDLGDGEKGQVIPGNGPWESESFNGKIKLNVYYPAIFIGVVILVLAGGCITDTTPSQTASIPTAIPASTAMNPPLSSITMTPAQPTSPVVPSPCSTQDPVSFCNPEQRLPVPVDTSVQVRDPMPGIRYFLNESDSGRTIVLENGEVVEINLPFGPGLPFKWIVAVSGCGLELVNDGAYIRGGDFWNNTGNYRARCRAVSHGTSNLDGKLVLTPDETGSRWFNVTVIVK
jgi:hypothetical protein